MSKKRSQKSQFSDFWWSQKSENWDFWDPLFPWVWKLRLLRRPSCTTPWVVTFYNFGHTHTPSTPPTLPKLQSKASYSGSLICLILPQGDLQEIVLNWRIWFILIFYFLISFKMFILGLIYGCLRVFWGHITLEILLWRYFPKNMFWV